MILIVFLFFCRLGIDEELVALLGKHSPVGNVLVAFVNNFDLFFVPVIILLPSHFLVAIC